MSSSKLICFDSQLLENIRFHRDNEAKSMLSQKLAREYDTDGSTTLLHHAALYGNATIARHLIKLGCEVDALQENSRETALMIAVEQEHVATVKVLLEANANIFTTAANGKSALQMVFDPQYFNPHIVEAFLHRLQIKTVTVENLVRKLMETGCTIFHAAYLRDVEVLNHMYNRGYDVNSRGPQRMTALHAAVEVNDLKLAKWLAGKGADLNALDEDKKSPLFLAALHGRMEILQFLLESGAKPRIENF